MVLAEMGGKLEEVARCWANSARLQWASGTPELRGKPQARAVTRAGQVVEAATLFPATSPFAHQTIADSKGESDRLVCSNRDGHKR